MKIVYISSPYSGNVERNTANARRYMKFAIDQGVCPIVPHLLYPQVLDDSKPEEREKGFDLALTLVHVCDEIWFFGKFSYGMVKEISSARKRFLPFRVFDDDCNEVKPEIKKHKVDHFAGHSKKEIE